MPSTAILFEIQKLYGVSDRLESLAENIPSSQKHSSPFREAFATRQLCWKCWSLRKWRGSPDCSQQMPDLCIAVWELGLWN
jgi:hypothetical protein